MDQLPVNPQDSVSTQVLPKDKAGDGRKGATTNGEEESEPFWEEENGGWNGNRFPFPIRFQCRRILVWTYLRRKTIGRDKTRKWI